MKTNKTISDNQKEKIRNFETSLKNIMNYLKYKFKQKKIFKN